MLICLSSWFRPTLTIIGTDKVASPNADGTNLEVDIIYGGVEFA